MFVYFAMYFNFLAQTVDGGGYVQLFFSGTITKLSEHLTLVG
ncbi:MAG: hypothetical protein ACHBN1_33735 [Heteroscytonema crispum UTEX LB 1556]